MPTLENARWEQYAFHRAKGYSLADAYIAAGYHSKDRDNCRVNAARLERMPEIKARIEEYLKELANTPEGVEQRREWFIRKFMELGAKADANGKEREANAAYWNAAQVAGVVTQRVSAEVKAEIRTPSPDELLTELRGIVLDAAALEDRSQDDSDDEDD